MQKPTGTVTLLFTDIESSTQHWEAQRAAMPQVLRRHDELMRSEIEAKGGYIFKTMGDAFCAVFSRPDDAINAAVEAQRALQAEDWSAVGGLQVRMALHSGATDERDGDYFGPAVNRVARLLAVVHGGQVVVSEATEQLLWGVMPEQIELYDLGEHRLKDLVEPERIWQLIAPGIPETFPALRSPESLPNNLPRELTPLIGRDEVVAEVVALVNEHPLVTLVGSGGVGKTRAALQVAANLLDGSADGVWFVELAPLSDPTLVAGQIASVLGLREVRERPIREILLEFLRKRGLLLVLDNCEHLIGETAAIADDILQTAAHVHILATSREGLGIPAEHAYRMPSLQVPAAGALTAKEAQQYGAIALFVERARAADARFTLTNDIASSVAEICRRLDGIPLAIELAAARVKVLSIPNLAQRLDERFRILAGGSRTALPRHQTMRALIDWSYDLLSEQEQTLFRRLGIFAGGWTLEAAERVCAGDHLDSMDVLDLLSSLVEKSLVVAEISGIQSRYGLLESTRAYALEKMTEAGERERLARRHAQWMAECGDHAEEVLREVPLERWLPEAKPEVENARAALTWALGDAKGATLGARIAAGLRGLWDTRERRHWLQASLAGLDEAEEPAIAARLWLKLALTLTGARRVEAADHALAIQGGFKDVRDVALCLAVKAFGLGLMGRIEAAAELNDRALQMLEEARLTRSFVCAYVMDGMGTVATWKGDLDAARSFYAKALALSEALGDRFGAALHRGNLAELEFQDGNAQRALALAEETRRTLSQELIMRTPLLTLNLPPYQIALGHFDEARRLAGEALSGAHALSGMECARAIQHLATVAAIKGNAAGAARLLGYVDAWYDREGDDRDYTERYTYDILIRALREELSDAELEPLTAAGAALSEDEAVAEALAV